jgi:hypothetical protein
MTKKPIGHNPLKRLPHPSDSLDISPSDFYLFGKVKNALIGREVPGEIDLLETATEISNKTSIVCSKTYSPLDQLLTFIAWNYYQCVSAQWTADFLHVKSLRPCNTSALEQLRVDGSLCYF